MTIHDSSGRPRCRRTCRDLHGRLIRTGRLGAYGKIDDFLNKDRIIRTRRSSRIWPELKNATQAGRIGGWPKWPPDSDPQGLIQRLDPRNRNICGSTALTRLHRRRIPLKCYELQGPNGIDGLALVDKPVPEPGAGEVLVRLKAATLNYRDLLTVKGGYGSRQKFPLVPVSDGAGVVERVGPGVREFAAGDRVIGSFFESWIGGEPSEAKMRRALGGSVDGVLTRVSDLSEARAGQDAGAPQRRRSRRTALRRGHGLERGHQARRHQARPDRADARHRRGIPVCHSVCQNVRRARHCDLVQRRQDRTPQDSSAPTSR